MGIPSSHCCVMAAAVFTIAGCGTPPATVPSPAAPSYVGLRHVSASPRPGRSWMSPAAKKGALLYVSNAGSSHDVVVYSWPALTQVGDLTAFGQPYAMCVDKAQDVYITDFPDHTIVEYAHGAKKPKKTLFDHAGSPNACAVDPSTGNLAVSNYQAPAAAPGNILVFTGATGTPTQYSAPTFNRYYFPGYDNGGNLFIDGENKADAVLLAELPKGGNTFALITMNRTLQFPGCVQWDGEFLGVGDQRVNVIYQFSVSGSNATEEGFTKLNGAGDVYQCWFTGATKQHPQAKAVLGADVSTNIVGKWAYPAGGASLKKITGLDSPQGVVLSK